MVNKRIPIALLAVLMIGCTGLFIWSSKGDSGDQVANQAAVFAYFCFLLPLSVWLGWEQPGSLAEWLVYLLCCALGGVLSNGLCPFNEW